MNTKDHKQMVETAKGISEKAGEFMLGKCFCKSCGEKASITNITLINNRLHTKTNCSCGQHVGDYCMICGELESNGDHTNCTSDILKPVQYPQNDTESSSHKFYCMICGRPSPGMRPCSECTTQNEDVMKVNDMCMKIDKLMNRDICRICGIPYHEHTETCKVDINIQEIYCTICGKTKIPKPHTFCADCGEEHPILKEADKLQNELTLYCTICGEKYDGINKHHPECEKQMVEQLKLEMGVL